MNTISAARAELSTLSRDVSMSRCTALLLDVPGRVVELRVLGAIGAGKSGIKSGYFDNVEAITKAAISVDGRCSGVYVTMNPVQRALLARSANLLHDRPKQTTNDSEVESRRFILVDIDPKRVSGVSSTDEEHEAAWALAGSLLEYLSGLDYPTPCVASSGNGVHLIYRVELPSSDGALVKSFLRSLAFRFNTADVQVDESVDNPSRLLKFYGTMTCKGSGTSDRPHRRSALWLPEGGPAVVDRELIARVAQAAPSSASMAVTTLRRQEQRLDVDEWLAGRGVAVRNHGPWNGGSRWVLERCPKNPEHADGAAYVVQLHNGAIAAGCLHNSCSGWGWHDLREQLQPEWRRPSGGSDGFAGPRVGASEPVWAAPQPIEVPVPPVPEVPVQDLPDELRGWLVDSSERIGCPLDFLVVGALVGVSALVGNKVGIRPKRHDNWTVVPNLWGAIVGRPGVMKSPALNEVLAPLTRIEGERQVEYSRARIKYEGVLLAWEAKRKKLGTRGKQADAEIDEVARALAESKPIPPPCPRRVVNDCTVEKLVDILRDNPHGVLLFRDELVGLLKSLDKDGHETDRSFYLESWNGTGSFTLDRVVRGTVRVESLVLSILGGIQPGPLLGYMKQNAGAGDDGFIQRFQLVVWPEPGPWRNVDRRPDGAAFEAGLSVYQRLDQLVSEDFVCGEGEEGAGRRPFLHFDDEAQELFDAWRGKLEERIRGEQDSDALESHLAKYRSLGPSLALLFYLIDGGRTRVDGGAFRRALSFMAYFEGHARKVYGSTSVRTARVALLLSRKITSGKLRSPFTARDVYQNSWSGLTDPDEVTRAASYLEDRDWLRSERSTNVGRPTVRFHINPQLLVAGASTDLLSEPNGAQADGGIAQITVGASVSAEGDGGWPGAEDLA
jgi:hypothetical protein